MKIKHKILTGYGLTALFATIIILIQIYYNFENRARIQRISSYFSDVMVDAGKMYGDLQSTLNRLEILDLQLSENNITEAESTREEMIQYIHELRELLTNWDNRLDSAYNPDLIELGISDLNEFKLLKDEIFYLNKLIEDLVSINYRKYDNDSFKKSEAEIHKFAHPTLLKLKKIENTSMSNLANLLELLSILSDKVFYLSLALTILLILMSVFSGWWIFQSISNPIEKLKKAFQEIKEGNYQTKIRISENDEIGSLVKSFNSLSQALEESKNELIGKNLELQNINQTLVVSKEKAEQADKLKSSFLANMSHEIRTPLNGIIGYADLLRNPNKTPEKQLRYVDMIKNCGKQLLRIINDILDISRIEAGTMKINESSVELNQLIDDTRNWLETESIRLGKNFKIKVFKAVERNLYIRADEQRLRQILTNLSDNALKYTSDGEISFAYTNNGDMLEFMVKDTGIGIKEDQYPYLFDRFNHQTNNIVPKDGGTGLGLAICKGLVEIMGGKIWIESEPGKGTQVNFTLPFHPDEKLNFNSELISHIQYNWESKTILMVEDDPMNVEFISEILSETGVKILYESSGLNALEICRNTKALDLVLMDIKLRDLDGFETTRKIKEFHPNLPIIAITAHSLPEYKQKSIDSGCNAFITKPFEHNELLMLIDQYIIQNKIKDDFTEYLS